MSLSDELEEAVAKKVKLAHGQNVIVRDKKGTDVARGVIREVHPEIGVVRVQDLSSGADLQVDVDVRDYDLYVQTDEEQLPLVPSELTVYTRVWMASF